DPVARRARDGLRTAEQPLVDATKRSLRTLGRRAATEPFCRTELVLEEQLPEVGELVQADLAVGDALRVERGAHVAQEGARRRCFAKAQLLPPRRQPLRLARRLDVERCRSCDGGTVGAPGGDLVPVRVVAARCEPKTQRHGPRPLPWVRHGTNSFGWRDSDVRKTRTLARSRSS